MSWYKELNMHNNSIENAVLDALNNTISNLQVTNLKAGVLDTDLSSVSASHDTIPSAKAVTDFIATVTSGASHDMGNWDASTTSTPTTGSGEAGAILKGDFWRISVAGTISGLGDLQVGDLIYAKVNSATSGTDYFAIQGNVAEATTTVLGLVMKASAAEAELKTLGKAVTCDALSAFNRGREVTVSSDGVTTSYTVIHNMGKALKNLVVSVRDGTTEEEQFPLIQKAGSNTSNQFTVVWSPAYPSGSFVVTITGL